MLITVTITLPDRYEDYIMHTITTYSQYIISNNIGKLESFHSKTRDLRHPFSYHNRLEIYLNFEI